MVTRSKAQARELVDRLRDLGAEVLGFPTIEIADPTSWEEADTAIRNLGLYDWLVFSSANAVECFFARLAVHDLDARSLSGTSVAAVGPATAGRACEHGVTPDWVPAEHTGEGLLAGFVERGVGSGRRVLVPRAEEGRDVLPDGLRERGVRVDVVPVYRTVAGAGDPETLERMLSGDADVLTFTSPSTLKNFLRLVGEEEGRAVLERVVVASIGPVTTRAAERLGVRVDVEPSPHTAPALADALAARYARETSGGTCWGYEGDEGA